MADEQQQTPEAAAPAAPTPPPADDGFVVTDGKGTATTVAADAEPAKVAKVANSDEPGKSDKPDGKPDPAPVEDDLPLGAKKRVARAERQRDEMSEKLAEAQRMIDELKARKDARAAAEKLDPNDFPDYGAYLEASKKAGEPEPAPPVDRELTEAVADLKETMTIVDDGLWAKFRELDDKGAPVINNVSREMVLELADFAAEGGDIAGKMRALAALTNEQRAEIAGMSPRGVRRALRELGVAPAAAATPAPAPAATPAPPSATPPRDPSTGQFRKPSSAPPPISPLDNGAPAPAGLDKLSTDDFIERRNAEERNRSSFGW